VGKQKDPLHGKRDPVSQLYRAVKRYVESHDGTVFVIGGIQVGYPIEGGNLNYHVAVRCLGRAPSFDKATEAAIKESKP
jgi:hypothetical protein